MSYVPLEHSNQMTRRTFLLGAAKGVLMMGLVGRVYQLQVFERSHYETLSDENRIAFRIVPAPRGRILDRWGKPIVNNKNSFQAVLVAEKAPDLQEAIRNLESVIDLSHIDTSLLLQKLNQKASSLVPLLIKDQLTWEEVSAIETNRSFLPGVMVEVGQNRHYIYDEAMGHLVGYVGYPSKQETSFSKYAKVPGFSLGKVGVEKTCDDLLQGIPGARSVEMNARRHVVRNLGYQEPQVGSDLTLSIDHRLQLYVSQRLQNFHAAAAVVLDVQTGETLAFVSTPSFNPNAFIRGISQPLWKELTESPYTPLLNRVTSGLYAPASTLKMVVALAALSQGVVHPKQRINCTGFVTLGDHRFHCWANKHGGHGPLTAQEAITRSCDVFFYEVGKRLGIEGMLPFFHAFGLGKRLLTDFPGEKEGLVPSPKRKKELRKENWTVGDTLLTSIGQGLFQTTPLQLAVMAARLATGQLVTPSYLVKETSGSRAFSALPLSISKEHLKIVQDGMVGAVNDSRGTSYRWRIEHPHAQMAGKTGTSQVRRISMADRKAGRTRTDHLPWHERENALFCGYAPHHAPRYAVSVLVEHGGFGSAVAAPVGRDILWMAQVLEKQAVSSD